jgi:hypothetical protein
MMICGDDIFVVVWKIDIFWVAEEGDFCNETSGRGVSSYESRNRIRGCSAGLSVEEIGH